MSATVLPLKQPSKPEDFQGLDLDVPIGIDYSKSESESLATFAAILLDPLDAGEPRAAWIDRGISLWNDLGEKGLSLWETWSRRDSWKSSKTRFPAEKASIRKMRRGVKPGKGKTLGTIQEDSGITVTLRWLHDHGFEYNPETRGIILSSYDHVPAGAQDLVNDSHTLELEPDPQPEPGPSRAQVADDARKLWEKAKPATGKNPYLASKQLPAVGELRTLPKGEGSGCGLSGEVLLVRYFDDDGFAYLQQVVPREAATKSYTGPKPILKGAIKARSYGSLLGPLTGQESLVTIHEGVGDAAAVAAATEGHSEPIVPIVAGDVRHMAPTILLIREICPSAAILACCDFDESGRMAEARAIEAACTQAGAVPILPRFEGWKGEKQPDFCDVRQHQGDEALKVQIAEGLELAIDAKGSLDEETAEAEAEAEAEAAAFFREKGMVATRSGTKVAFISFVPKPEYLDEIGDDPEGYYAEIDFSLYEDVSKTVDHVWVGEGKGAKQLFDYWKQSRSKKMYKGVIFKPIAGQLSPAVLKDTTLPKPNGMGMLNIYTGLEIEPKEGDCQPILDHINKIWCQNNEVLYDYVINWIARMFQYPGERGHTALVLQSGQGKGKGIITDIITEAFGAHSFTASSADHALNHFNMRLATSIFVNLNEVTWGGNKQAEGTLKALITDKSFLAEEKYKPKFPVSNFTHIMVTSNERWAVPISIDDRRFVTLTLSNEFNKNSKTGKKLIDCINNGGKNTFIHYLLNKDISKFDPRDMPECNSAERYEQKLLSAEPFARWWHHQLVRGEDSPLFEREGSRKDRDFDLDTETGELADNFQSWKYGAIQIRKSTFDEVYTNYLKDQGISRKGETATLMGRRLKEVCPSVDGDQKLKNEFRTDEEKMKRKFPRCYVVPSLKEAREAFDKWFGQPYEWDDDGQEGHEGGEGEGN